MKYTCAEYRQEMLLLALRKRLNEKGLSEKERKKITAELQRLEAQMQMD